MGEQIRPIEDQEPIIPPRTSETIRGKAEILEKIKALQQQEDQLTRYQLWPELVSNGLLEELELKGREANAVKEKLEQRKFELYLERQELQKQLKLLETGPETSISIH